MTRILLVNLLLFLLPFIAYGLWRRIVHGERSGRLVFEEAPAVILLAAGVVLASVGLFFLASYDRQSVERRYVPPAYKNGAIQPGHFEKR